MRLRKRIDLNKLVIGLVLTLATIPAFSSILQVPDEYSTIQSGIDAAENGDTVIVAEGIYYENVDFSGKSILLTSHFHYDQDQQFIDNTIINGSMAADPECASAVTFFSNENEDAILQGFTITGGSGTAWVDMQFPEATWYSGGGIIIYQASPTIRNNLITMNVVTNPGVYNGASGGGLLCFRGNPLIFNNQFINNQADYGAGLVVDFSGAVIRNNIIAYNSGGELYGGGGLYCIGTDDDPILIENNVIYGNYSQTTGGAIRLWTTDVTARNNIIWANSQNSGGPINGNSINISYCDIEGGWTGTGNIDEDPQIVDFTTYQIDEFSPCVDAGDPDESFNDPEDPSTPGQALFPALGTIRNDLGAYGGPYTSGWEMTSADDSFLDQGSLRHFELNAFPNPFNPETRISFRVQENIDQDLELSIFNIKGQKIKDFSLSFGFTQDDMKDRYSVIWDGKDDMGEPAGSGIYFYTLSSSSYSESKKLILLK